MSTPLIENNTFLIDHLDFDIQCQGVFGDNDCSNRAVYLFIFDCGCQFYKCVECSQAWKADDLSFFQKYGTREGECWACNKDRNDDNLIIIPL